MRSRFLIGIFFAGVLSVGSVMEASAQAWNGVPVCTTGGLNVCVSVNVLPSLSPYEVNFSVTNLFGIDPAFDAANGTQSSWITAIGFYHLIGNDVWDDPGRDVTALDVDGGAWLSDPSYTPSSQIWKKGGYVVEVGADANGLKDGIPDGQTYTFNFSLNFEFAFTEDTQLRWHAQSIGGPGGESIKCDTYFSDNDSYAPCNVVVPEPLTMALLGTGLFGVGIVGAIRRRRNGLDVVDG